MFSVSKAKHASSTGSTLKLHVLHGGGGGQTGFLFIISS